MNPYLARYLEDEDTTISEEIDAMFDNAAPPQVIGQLNSDSGRCTSALDRAAGGDNIRAASSFLANASDGFEHLLHNVHSQNAWTHSAN